MNYFLLSGILFFLSASASASAVFDGDIGCFEESLTREEIVNFIEELERFHGEKYHEDLLQCYLRIENYQNIKILIGRIGESGNSPVYIHHYLGMANYGLGLYQQSQANFLDSINAGMYSYKDAIYLARSYKASGDYQRAKKTLEDYLEWLQGSSPDPGPTVISISDAEVYAAIELSDIFQNEGDEDMARSVLLRAFKRNSGSRVLYDQMMSFLSKNGPESLYDEYRHRENSRRFLD